MGAGRPLSIRRAMSGRDKHVDWSLTDGTLRPSKEYAPGYELALVNLLRERVAAWRQEGYSNLTGTTLQLLQWWRREGRERPLFFAQVEAAETVIFLKEARSDFLQGVNVPRDEPSDERKAEGFAGFLRYACKMATGSGKTTVMGMLAAWSILNKVHDHGDARFPDVVLVVCPNVTIRSRLAELDPKNGEASIYTTRDLVPPNQRKDLSQGTVLVMNWHEAKGDEVRWMRFTLDTVGKTDWPMDRQGRPQYPDGFEELTTKLERPLSPPGRDARCIVSVAMLTEGWDCNTVTHIIGLRPFMWHS
jgi:hypothetical protein